MLTTINKNPNPIIPYDALLVMVTPLAVGTDHEAVVIRRPDERRHQYAVGLSIAMPKKSMASEQRGSHALSFSRPQDSPVLGI
jgi:hypothetical protein